MNQKALLLGNGINRLSSQDSISWKGLLLQLSKDFNITSGDNYIVPATLQFEQMVNLKPGANNSSKKNHVLKNRVAEIFDVKSKPNDFHRQFFELENYSDILTTNYDYNLESSVCSDFKTKKREYYKGTSEKITSFKRYYEIDGKRVWHIHGEIEPPKYIKEGEEKGSTILIGFEHYSQYLQRIIDIVFGNYYKSDLRSYNVNKIEHKALDTRLNDSNYINGQIPIWVDLFFTRNLDIIGFSLDFSENHLWWLLAYRAQKIKNNNSCINNSIRYFYPNIVEEEKKDISEEEKARIIYEREKKKGTLALLESLNVELFSINCDNYPDFYKKTLSILSDN